VHQSEHGLSAVISHHRGEPYSITGPAPFAEETHPLPAYSGILHTPQGWWGVVVHCPRGTHPQAAIAHYEPTLHPVKWLGNKSTIGLYLLPTSERVVTARIPERQVAAMKAEIAEHHTTEFADSRFAKRRVPAGLRWLPGQQMQLWFSL
jgi:hypothetical protein